MKITLSKLQWELIGTRTGWIKTAKIGSEFLKAKGVPQQNIPATKAYLDSLPDNIAKFLMKNYIIKNPNISIQELKQVPLQLEKTTKIPKEMEEVVSQITSDKIGREWLRKLVVIGRFKKEDSVKLYNLLKDFNNLSEGENITQFKDDVELSEFVQSKKTVEYSKPSGKFKLLENENVNGKNVKLYHIFDQKALDSIGGDANWCVLTKNGQEKEKPFKYYCFVIDGVAEVLIHQNSGQMKNKHDDVLKNGTLVKLINPYVEKHGLNEMYENGGERYEDDFTSYNNALRLFEEIEEKALSNDTNDKEFINQLLVKDPNNFSLIPEKVWYKYVNHFGDQLLHPKSPIDSESDYKAIDYKAIEYLATYYKINKNEENFEKLRKYYSNKVCSVRGNLTVGRYKKLVPDILRTNKTNDEFNTKQIEVWVNYIMIDSRAYKDCPEEFKQHTKIQRARLESLINLINKDPLNYKYNCPEELKQHPEIQKAHFESWINYIIKRAYNYKYCPEEFKQHSEIQKAHLEGWINAIRKYPNDNYQYCPKEFKQHPRILELLPENQKDKTIISTFSNTWIKT